jgi:hypothetical protein
MKIQNIRRHGILQVLAEIVNSFKVLKVKLKVQIRWHRPANSALGKLRQED